MDKLMGKEPWAIDESTLVKEEFTIPEGMMPKGNWWDADGGCFKAELQSETVWRWAPKNATALASGYYGQELFPFVLPKGSKSDK